MAKCHVTIEVRIAAFLFVQLLLTSSVSTYIILPNNDELLDSLDVGLYPDDDTLSSSPDQSEGDTLPEVAGDDDGSVDLGTAERWNGRDKRWTEMAACRQCMHRADRLSCRVCYGSRGNVNVPYFGMEKRYTDDDEDEEQSMKDDVTLYDRPDAELEQNGEDSVVVVPGDRCCEVLGLRHCCMHDFPPAHHTRLSGANKFRDKIKPAASLDQFVLDKLERERGGRINENKGLVDNFDNDNLYGRQEFYPMLKKVVSAKKAWKTIFFPDDNPYRRW